MAFSISINLILFLVIMFIFKEILTQYSPYSRRFIITTILLIVLNTFFTYNYIQIKSNHNNSTYITYHVLMDSLDRMNKTNDINSVSGIRDMKNTLIDVNKQIGLLLMQMDYSKLATRKDQNQLKASLNRLSNELYSFILYHNKVFADGEDIPIGQFGKYEELRSEIINLHQELNSNSSSRMSFGIIKHTLRFEGKQLTRLDKATMAISQMITEITADLTCDN